MPEKNLALPKARRSFLGFAQNCNKESVCTAYPTELRDKLPFRKSVLTVVILVG